jgi:hypothetical protein
MNWSREAKCKWVTTLLRDQTADMPFHPTMMLSLQRPREDSQRSNSQGEKGRATEGRRKHDLGEEDEQQRGRGRTEADHPTDSLIWAVSVSPSSSVCLVVILSGTASQRGRLVAEVQAIKGQRPHCSSVSPPRSCCKGR